MNVMSFRVQRRSIAALIVLSLPVAMLIGVATLQQAPPPPSDPGFHAGAEGLRPRSARAARSGSRPPPATSAFTPTCSSSAWAC